MPYTTSWERYLSSGNKQYSFHLHRCLLLRLVSWDLYSLYCSLLPSIYNSDIASLWDVQNIINSWWRVVKCGDTNFNLHWRSASIQDLKMKTRYDNSVITVVPQTAGDPETSSVSYLTGSVDPSPKLSQQMHETDNLPLTSVIINSWNYAHIWRSCAVHR
jgi:hypothetical protein